MVARVAFDQSLIITCAGSEPLCPPPPAREPGGRSGPPAPRQPVQIAVDHDAVEAMVYQSEQIAEQQGEQFHRNFTLRKGGPPWGRERSDADRASTRSAARISGWPTKSATSSAAPPPMTGGGGSYSVVESCSCLYPLRGAFRQARGRRGA